MFGIDCHVYLIATLATMPQRVDRAHEFYILVNRNYKTFPEQDNQFRVIVSADDAKRIQQYGFPGMKLIIHGDLRNKKYAEIVAEKIDFDTFPNPAEFTTGHPEMSYWFSKDGSLRPELARIH